MSKLLRKVDRLSGQRDALLSQKKKQIKERRALRQDKKRHLAAQALLQSAATRTQDQLKVYLTSVVNLALCEVFGEGVLFEIEFEKKKGTSYAELNFVKDGNRISPLDASGCGMVDLAALCLRLTLWSLERPALRPVLVMDEPLKFLSKDLVPDAVELLKGLSKDLGVQIIMVTHDEALVEAGDKVYRVSQDRKGISQVEEVL